MKTRITNRLKLLTFLWIIAISISGAYAAAPDDSNDNLQVIYAVNAGSKDHTDENSIHYIADPLKVGIDSDFGKNLLIIAGVPEQDEILYRTERYHTSTFGYDLPLQGDGDYALVLKFCEVYFNEEKKKIFDVVLNRKHEVVSNLDIFARVGRGVAHDEYVYFTVSRGKLHYKDEVSDVRNNILRLEFIKGSYDNPKINAFVLFKGDVDKITKFKYVVKKEPEINDLKEPAITERIPTPTTKKSQTASTPEEKKPFIPDPIDDDDDNLIVDDEDDLLFTDTRKNSKTSGPRQPNPYTMDDSMVLMPVFIAIGCFIPLLFCLCKL